MVQLIVLFLGLGAADDSYVFVHQNGTVALHQAGSADLVLFDRGREPSRCGGQVFYWNDRGIVRADVATRKATLWRAGNLRSPKCDGRHVIFCEMVGSEWAVLISPADKADPKLLFHGVESVFNPSFSAGGVVVSDLSWLYFVSLDGKLQKKLKLSELGGGGSSSDRFLVRGTQILFTAPADPLPAMETRLHGEPSSALFLYDLETRRRTRLTPPDTFALDPVWIGERIYFRGFRMGKQPLREGILRLRLRDGGVERVAAGYEPGS